MLEHYLLQKLIVRRSLALAIFALLVAVPAEAATGTLYLIENLVTQGVVNTRALVRVSFNGTNQPIKETVMVKDQRFFGHSGGHQIEQERFMITHFGGVIDLLPGKVIHDEMLGDLLTVENGLVVYRIENTRRENGVFSFDLGTGQITKFATGTHWDLPGAKSPDKTMSVRQDRDGVIRLYKLAGKPVDLAKGFAVNYSSLSSTREVVPCLWLDAGRILTVQSNRKLVTVTTNGMVTPFVEVKEAPTESVAQSSLEIDVAGRILYVCDSEDFLIDPLAKTSRPLERYVLGHGFEASVAADEQRRHTAYYEGRVIGQWVFNPQLAKTAPGVIAFAYVEPGANANLGAPTGVTCWTGRAVGWQSLKMWVNDLVGWTN